ncbi:hypothetical protein N7492_001955 [Penicillium capsulatum]|uniref:Uncharacterized protein n=1 Tax=Penicillium capsulatum TaxID=69766 RepID=A0A9W9IHP3_9EURO|nr:hypothetical protein N7492_001955 [Penicillium capsulatum]
MGSQDSTETSIGNYPSNSSGSSLDSSSEDRRTWTKFQRDMFQEYGITAQELASAPDRLGFPCNHAQAHNVSAGTVLVRKKLDSWDGPVTMGPPRVNGTSMVEKDTSNLNATVRAKSTVFSPKGEYQQLSSTEIHDADLSMRESHQGSSNPMDWILALQAAQKSAHGLLQDTNQVLQIYRQGCNRILDDLFEAQEVRMELYRRQMTSVKTQHTQICQELIRGLQEMDRRVQQG